MKKGWRAANISWRAACGPRAALWPCLVYTFESLMLIVEIMKDNTEIEDKLHYLNWNYLIIIFWTKFPIYRQTFFHCTLSQIPFWTISNNVFLQNLTQALQTFKNFLGWFNRTRWFRLCHLRQWRRQQTNLLLRLYRSRRRKWCKSLQI